MHLCALITTGLIIDAFGELRDQQEQVKEDMEVGHVEGQTLGTWGPQGEGCLMGLHSDVSHDRPSASSAASVVTTSILHRMGLRPTHWRNTTWPITCKYLVSQSGDEGMATCQDRGVSHWPISKEGWSNSAN